MLTVDVVYLCRMKKHSYSFSFLFHPDLMPLGHIFLSIRIYALVIHSLSSSKFIYHMYICTYICLYPPSIASLQPLLLYSFGWEKGIYRDLVYGSLAVNVNVVFSVFSKALFTRTRFKCYFPAMSNSNPRVKLKMKNPLTLKAKTNG